MIFESIKEHFKQKKQKRQVDFVFELVKDDKKCYIVEQKIAELMLAGGWELESLLHCNYAQSKGWHVGNDEKIYESFELNEKGDWLYDFCGTKAYGIKYLAALVEMNQEIRPAHLYDEKKAICHVFEKEGIRNMRVYNKEERKYSSEEQEKVIEMFKDISKNGKEYELKEPPISHKVYKR